LDVCEGREDEREREGARESGATADADAKTTTTTTSAPRAARRLNEAEGQKSALGSCRRATVQCSADLNVV